MDVRTQALAGLDDSVLDSVIGGDYCWLYVNGGCAVSAPVPPPVA